jgi:uncharacterized RDD family membrane protein YckC
MAYPVPQADPTSVFGRRILAVLIDLLLIWIPILGVASADFEYLTTETLADEGLTGEAYCDVLTERGDVCADLTDMEGIEAVYFSEGWSATTNLVFWLLPFALLVVLQGFTGWSPGKLITGIRVVQEDGRPPGFVKALLRWLLWIVDGFPWLIPGLVGFITGLTTVGHRRVGDMAAKTFVVRKGAAGAPVAIAGLTTTPPTSDPWGTSTPPGWAPPADPATQGWPAPTPAPPPVVAPPAPVAKEGPQWDQARGTYIQWDPDLRSWMQWDDVTKAWSRIPGQ